MMRMSGSVAVATASSSVALSELSSTKSFGNNSENNNTNDNNNNNNNSGNNMNGKSDNNNNNNLGESTTSFYSMDGGLRHNHHASSSSSSAAAAAAAVAAQNAAAAAAGNSTKKQTMRIRISNSSNDRSKDLMVPISMSNSLFDTVYDNKSVKDAHVRKWSKDVVSKVKSKKAEIQCIVWDDQVQRPSHTFTVEELKSTSTRQLHEMYPFIDPLKLILECVDINIDIDTNTNIDTNTTNNDNHNHNGDSGTASSTNNGIKLSDKQHKQAQVDRIYSSERMARVSSLTTTSEIDNNNNHNHNHKIARFSSATFQDDSTNSAAATSLAENLSTANKNFSAATETTEATTATTKSAKTKHPSLATSASPDNNVKEDESNQEEEPPQNAFRCPFSGIVVDASIMENFKHHISQKTQNNSMTLPPNHQPPSLGQLPSFMHDSNNSNNNSFGGRVNNRSSSLSGSNSGSFPSAHFSLDEPKEEQPSPQIMNGTYQQNGRNQSYPQSVTTTFRFVPEHRMSIAEMSSASEAAKSVTDLDYDSIFGGSNPGGVGGGGKAAANYRTEASSSVMAAASQQQQQQSMLKSTLRIRITNKSSNRFKDLVVDIKDDLNLFDAVYDNQTVKDAHVRKWSKDIASKVKAKKAQIQLVVWDNNLERPWHTFQVEDLKTTSTRELFEVVESNDLIQLFLECVDIETTDNYITAKNNFNTYNSGLPSLRIEANGMPSASTAGATSTALPSLSSYLDGPNAALSPGPSTSGAYSVGNSNTASCSGSTDAMNSTASASVTNNANPATNSAVTAASVASKRNNTSTGHKSLNTTAPSESQLKDAAAAAAAAAKSANAAAAFVSNMKRKPSRPNHMNLASRNSMMSLSSCGTGSISTGGSFGSNAGFPRRRLHSTTFSTSRDNLNSLSISDHNGRPISTSNHRQLLSLSQHDPIPSSSNGSAPPAGQPKRGKRRGRRFDIDSLIMKKALLHQQELLEQDSENDPLSSGVSAGRNKNETWNKNSVMPAADTSTSKQQNPPKLQPLHYEEGARIKTKSKASYISSPSNKPVPPSDPTRISMEKLPPLIVPPARPTGLNQSESNSSFNDTYLQPLSGCSNSTRQSAMSRDYMEDKEDSMAKSAVATSTAAMVMMMHHQQQQQQLRHNGRIEAMKNQYQQQQQQNPTAPQKPSIKNTVAGANTIGAAAATLSNAQLADQARRLLKMSHEMMSSQSTLLSGDSGDSFFDDASDDKPTRPLKKPVRTGSEDGLKEEFMRLCRAKKSASFQSSDDMLHGRRRQSTPSRFINAKFNLTRAATVGGKGTKDDKLLQPKENPLLKCFGDSLSVTKRTPSPFQSLRTVASVSTDASVDSASLSIPADSMRVTSSASSAIGRSNHTSAPSDAGVASEILTSSSSTAESMAAALPDDVTPGIATSQPFKKMATLPTIPDIASPRPDNNSKGSNDIGSVSSKASSMMSPKGHATVSVESNLTSTEARINRFLRRANKPTGILRKINSASSYISEAMSAPTTLRMMQDGSGAPLELPFSPNGAVPKSVSGAISLSSGRMQTNPDIPPISEIEVITNPDGLAPPPAGSVSSPGISLSPELVKEVFPYHVVLDSDFRILQVGNSLANLIDAVSLIGRVVSDILMVSSPIPMFGKWDWNIIDKMKDKTVFLESVLSDSLHRKVKIKGTIIELSQSPRQVMLSLLPNVKNLSELEEMNLSMADLPLHSCQREAVLMGEHNRSEVNLTNHLDQLHRDLIDSMEKQIEDRTNELATANEDLERANSQLALQSARQLEHFACMSHEIRTPLNCIVGMSSLLLDDAPIMDPMHADSIRMISTSGELLKAVVDDVLDYAKLESGSFEVDIKQTNLQETLDSVVHSISQKVQEKNIRLRTHYSPMLPKMLETDSRRLQQVLFNLLGNAGKFSKANSVIDLCVHFLPGPLVRPNGEPVEDGDSVKNIIRFSVKDYGKGIEKKDFETIFQPFSQASKETQNIYGGTGLGLSITSKLVHRLGGIITLDSEYGKFAEFAVTLPFNGPEVDPESLKRRMKDTTIVLVEPERRFDYSFTNYQIEPEPEPFVEEVTRAFGLDVIQCTSLRSAYEQIHKRRVSGVNDASKALSPTHHFAVLLREELYQANVFENFASIAGSQNYTLMTFGPNYSVQMTKDRHIKSLRRNFPSVLVETIANHVEGHKAKMPRSLSSRALPPPTSSGGLFAILNKAPAPAPAPLQGGGGGGLFAPLNNNNPPTAPQGGGGGLFAPLNNNPPSSAASAPAPQGGLFAPLNNLQSATSTPAPAPQGGGLFAPLNNLQSATPAPAPQGGLFAPLNNLQSSTPAPAPAPQGGLFAPLNNSQPPVAPAPAPQGGLFALLNKQTPPAAAAAASAPQGGLFAPLNNTPQPAPAPAPQGGLFAPLNNTPQPAPAPQGGLFAPLNNSQSAAPAPAPQGGGLFAPLNNPQPEVPAPAPQGGLFAPLNNPQPEASAPAPQGGLFAPLNSPSTAPAPAPQGGLFGPLYTSVASPAPAAPGHLFGPLNDHNSPENTVTSTVATAAPGTRGALKKKQASVRAKVKVLYAEDNLVNQKVLSKVLNRAGIIDITLVDDGKKAVDICKTVKFDMIFMDMQMPVMGGMEATKLIVEHDPTAKVVFVTAHALDEFKAQAVAIGATSFVSKPFRLADIENLLNSLVPIVAEPIPPVNASIPMPPLASPSGSGVGSGGDSVSSSKQGTINRNLKVLYAEDNAINQKVLSRVLNRAGISDVTIVDNGKKAVEITENNKYDCIFMDMQMPIMGGMEATKLIVQRDPAAKVIFVSAHALDEYKAQAAAVGALKFISKPCRLVDIENLLKSDIFNPPT